MPEALSPASDAALRHFQEIVPPEILARLGDYARERLGISGRELQSVAHVVSSMERLPRIGDAFDRADISWAQLRVIVEAATNVTQEHWLSLAGGRTVRALEALRKREKQALDQPAPADEDDDVIDGERVVLLARAVRSCGCLRS